MLKIILIFLLPTVVFGIGSSFTVKKIDRIENNTEAQITLVDSVKLDAGAVDSVLYLDSSKLIQSSIINQTELEYLDGSTSNIQGQIDLKLGKSLSDGFLLIGDASNLAAGVSMSGEASILNTGEITLDNDSVIDKFLTSFLSGSGVITSLDSVLTSIQKLDGNIGNKVGTTGDEIVGGVKNLSSELLMDQIGTPSNPVATKNKLYFKNDNGLYKLNSAGLEEEVGTGGAVDLSGLVKTPSTTSPVLYSAVISATGGVSNEYGSMLNGGCTQVTPMVCTFSVGKFTGTPNCWLSADDSGASSCNKQAINSTSFSFKCFTSAGVDVTNTIIKSVFCHGVE